MDDPAVDAIAQIKAARDQQIQGLSDALQQIRSQILAHTGTADLQDRLSQRQEDLSDEINAIVTNATDKVLELPEVQAAVDELTSLGRLMTRRAQEMKDAADKLSKAVDVLGVAQKFLDTIASKKK